MSLFFLNQWLWVATIGAFLFRGLKEARKVYFRQKVWKLQIP